MYPPSEYEKLGVFFLGRPYDLALKKPLEGMLLYKSKDLTTHAVCVGMTGSGKTGLCIALLEEAALDNIPSIIIDPKGDMSNLLLSFPELRGEDYQPWINEDDARRKGLSAESFAEQQADLWRNGLADWGQDGDRIRRMRHSVDFAVYTPGSNSGIPVSIMKSFDLPPAAVMEDRELLNDRLTTIVSSLLGLIGVDADPLRSREQILIASILNNAWQNGESLDLPALIQSIQSPPLEKIGVMTIESFFPAKERFELALAINNLLAAPGFDQWLQGEPLDIDSILYTANGKPRHAIFSIAHLNEQERMFFVSLLLNELLGWVRSQQGTTSLRAILYMDEIFGYFPPVSNPPSKMPLLTLLKQARAFGLGIVLTTQNPVDLDYKGLSNTGTWFIGRLQTERDKARVIEGLEGVSAATGMKFNRQLTEQIIAGLGNRVFLLNNVHENAPVIFETRWVMSYLRGPLTRRQIKQFKQTTTSSSTAKVDFEKQKSIYPDSLVSQAVSGASRPVVNPDIKQYFLPVRGLPPRGYELAYQPSIIAASQVRFIDTKSGLNESHAYIHALKNIDNVFSTVNWSEAEEIGLFKEDLEAAPGVESKFFSLPGQLGDIRNYPKWRKDYIDWVYGQKTIDLYRNLDLKVTSQPGESKRDFYIRIKQLNFEKRDEAVEKLRRKFETKTRSLQNRVLKAEQSVEREKEQLKQQKMQTAISLGATLFGSFLGGKSTRSSIGRITTTARGAGRTVKENKDVGLAKENLALLKQEITDLEKQFQKESHELALKFDHIAENIESLPIRPRKSEILVHFIGIGWLPMWRKKDGEDTIGAY